MPTEVSAPLDATDRQRLMSAKLGEAGPVARFIAERREPGDNWTQVETIAAQLYASTGETITRAGLTKWMAHYRIPMNTENVGTAKDVRDYRKAVAHILG